MCGRYWTGIKLLGGSLLAEDSCEQRQRDERRTHRLQKKYNKYIQMGIEGRKNCLVAGIKHTSSDRIGTATLTNMGIGAIAREKIMKPARAGYWMSSQPHLWRWIARTPSRGLKERCSLVMLVESLNGCLHGFLDRLLLLLLLAGRNWSGMLMLRAPGHCRCGICSLGLAWLRNELMSCIVAVAASSELRVWTSKGLVASRPSTGSVLGVVWDWEAQRASERRDVATTFGVG